MTDIPTPAPTDSAVEPDGVSEAQVRAELKAIRETGIPNLELYAKILRHFVKIKKERDELLVSVGKQMLQRARETVDSDALRQQLAEMRAALEYLLAATFDTSTMGVARDRARKALAPPASPSQPSRGKCETCGGIRVLRRVDFEGTPIDDAPCPDCAQPQSITQELREAAKCKTCNGRQRILQPISKTARNPVKPDELVRVQTFVPCPDCAEDK